MSASIAFALRVGPSGAGTMRVESFRAREGISELYRYDVVVSTRATHVERFALGQRALFAMRAAGRVRSVRGIIASVRLDGTMRSKGGELARYRLRLVPRAWLLRHRERSRIFRHLRVDQVIRAVLSEAGISARFHLGGRYPERDYTTQYAETDLAFVRRLASENGILFYFRQPEGLAGDAALGALFEESALEPGGPTAAEAQDLWPEEALVFTDEASYPPVSSGPPPGGFSRDPVVTDVVVGAKKIDAAAPAIPYRGHGALSGALDDFLSELRLRLAVRPTAAVYREHSPARPLAPTEASARLRGDYWGTLPGASEPGGTERQNLAIEDVKVATAEEHELEIYEHDAHTAFPDWEHDRAEPARILAQRRRLAAVADGRGTSARLEAGYRFAVEDHPVAALNGEYAAIWIEHEGVATFDAADGMAASYSNRFACVPAGVAYLPKRPRPRVVQACLTATVVGPASEDLHVNGQGEIKVRFHWDRSSGSADPTAWIRTMHAWAGAGWGTQFLPRVGMEVVVTFENGDPDRPLVLGCVYNAVHPPPFPLPRDKSRSGIRTKGSPDKDGWNELSFEDGQDREQIFLRAQRDYDALVLRNRTATVGADDTSVVRGDQRVEVGAALSTFVGGNRDAVVHGDDRSRVEGTRHEAVRGDLEELVEGGRSTRVGGRELREVVGESRLLVHGDVVSEVRGSTTMVVGRKDAKRYCTALVEGPTQICGADVIDVSSEREVLLRCGDSSIRISDGEIEIASPRVIVRGQDSRLVLEGGAAKLKVKSKWQVISDDSIVLKAKGASVGLGAEVKLDGAAILLNSPELATDALEAREPEPTTIELVDQHGRPIPRQRFRLILDDGREHTGFLDDAGKAELHVEGTGHILFPDLAGADPT